LEQSRDVLRRKVRNRRSESHRFLVDPEARYEAAQTTLPFGAFSTT